MHSIVGLWRWRGNSLCRRSDRREAWLALWAAVLILAGSPLVGWAGASRVYDSLATTAQRQQLEHHQVWATAEEIVVLPPDDTDPESASQGDEGRSRVIARWTGPDGSSHKGQVRAVRGIHPGDRFRIWTDSRGDATSRPVTQRTATAHAALAGLASTAAGAAAVEALRRLVLWRLLRRRYAQWDEEWQRIGPDWGRTGSSS